MDAGQYLSLPAGRPQCHTVTTHYPPSRPLAPYINACTRAPSHHPSSPPSLPHQIYTSPDKEAAASCWAAPTWGLWFLSKRRFFWLRSWPSASARRLGRRQRRQRRRRSWLAASSAWTAPPTMSMPSKVVHANRLTAHLHFWFSSVCGHENLARLELPTAFLSRKLYMILAGNEIKAVKSFETNFWNSTMSQKKIFVQ